MKSKKAIIMMWILAVAPLALVLVCMPHLPDQVPLQWGLNGQVRYGPKGELFLIAGLSPLLALLFQFLPSLDPRKQNYAKFQGYYDGFCVLMPLFLLLLTGITLSESFWPGRITVYKAVGILVGILFMVVGNMMGKLKSNFFMGIRTPWTLSDPDVWNKTQRLGGLVFFALGLGSILLCLLAPEGLYFSVFFGGVMAGVLLILFMSWWWYKKAHPQDDSP